MTNGGGLRETIAKGKPITKGNVIAVLPFGNTISQIQVTGQQVLDMFEKSLGSILQVDKDGKKVLDENGQPLLEPSGGFLQVSGVRSTMIPTSHQANVSWLSRLKTVRLVVMISWTSQKLTILQPMIS